MPIFNNSATENEQKQSLFRVLFTTFIFVYLLLNHASDAAITFVTSYLCVGIASFAFLNIYKKPSIIYRWITLFFDVFAVSIGLYLTSASGAIFLGVYLWLITGYGLRYGKNLLFGAYFLCISGFLLAINFNAYWHSHYEMVAGFLVTLVLIPLHVNSLLSKLANAIQNAEKASKVKTDFLSHISHEIRTPLNGVIGASYLLNETKLSNEQKELTTIIANSSTMVTDIISNVLDFSAIESGKIDLNPTEVNLLEFTHNIISLLKTQTVNKNIEIFNEFNLPSHSIVKADALRLKQVLINLLANSIKFTDSGFVKLRLNSTGNHKQNLIMFSVIDTGIGIQEQSLSKIYDSFTQADGSIKEKFGGTGLGLTISNSLVNLMGGKLEVLSEKNVGTTFTFTLDLPIVDKEQTKLTANSIQIDSPGHKYFFTPAKILVIEDNQTNLTIIDKALKLVGHKVEVAENGEKALDLLENNLYDVILLDNNLPDYNGFEIIRMYQALTINLDQAPIVILTADATVEERNKLISAGAIAYLTKPMDMQLLFNTIENLVGNQVKKVNQTAEIIPIKRKLKATQLPDSYLDIVHLTKMRLLLDRNDGFMINLIETFIHDANVHIETLKARIETNNYSDIKFITHTLAGTAVSVGATELSRLTIQIHDLNPSSDIEERTRIFEQLVYVFNKSKKELLEFGHSKTGS